MAKKGTPRASHWSAAGFTLSGLDDAMIMSTLLLRIRSPATCAEREAFDWVSSTWNSNLCSLPSPQTTPSLSVAVTVSTIHLSGLANEASAPVSGDRTPILMARPASAPAETVVVLAAAVVVVV